jgi:protease II
MFYIVTNADGDANFKIVRAPEKTPTKEYWQDDFLAERSDYRIEDADMFSGGCLVQQRAPTGLRELCWVPYANPDERVRVTLPGLASSKNKHSQQDGNTSTSTSTKHTFAGNVATVQLMANPDFSAGQATFLTSTPLAPQTIWQFNMASGEVSAVEVTAVAGSPRFNPGQYACSRSRCTSADGTAVPMTVIHRKGIQLNGDNPALVTVYGAYGECLEPEFRSDHLVYLQRGWVVVLCHVRGGGELGSKWHHGATGVRKQASIADLEACVESIAKRGYTRAGRTAVVGVSAGGLLVAALCNQRPDLLAAAVLRVPFVDPLTAMLDPTLPLTIHERPEWGDPVADRAAFDAIRGYCPYTNVPRSGGQGEPEAEGGEAERAAYPAVLATASGLDERVPAWQPAKYIARVRAAHQADAHAAGEQSGGGDGSTSRALLLVDSDNGHFGNAHAGAEVAFLFESLGLSLIAATDD